MKKNKIDLVKNWLEKEDAKEAIEIAQQIKNFVLERLPDKVNNSSS